MRRARKWIVVDSNALAWTAHHSFGKTMLEANGQPTNAIYGFLAAILRLQQELATEDIAFCFDYGKSKRYELLPTYKGARRKRRDEDPEAKAVYAMVSQQINQLRKRHLKNIGFRNVFFHKGYEADDLIASVCKNLRPKDEAVVVSADSDMLQLINKQVSVYIPTKKQLITRKSFVKQYGIRPPHWATVKILAGCSSDNVPGVKGVGELTALKYIKNTLKENSKKHYDIEKAIEGGILERNRRLVELPFPGTPDCILRTGTATIGWGTTMDELKIKSLSPKEGYMPAYRE